MPTRQLTRFVLTGLAATLVHYAVLRLCVNGLGLDPVLATFPAFGLAFLLGYTLNRNWTFGSDVKHRHALPAYLGLALLGLANNALLMQLFVHGLGQSLNLGFLAGMATTPLLSYLVSRFWIFHPPRNGNPPKTNTAP